MWPADIFAYKRIINEKGLINTPRNSIGAKTIFIGHGTPGIQKMCFQYSFLPDILVITNVIRAKQKVTAIYKPEVQLPAETTGSVSTVFFYKT